MNAYNRGLRYLYHACFYYGKLIVCKSKCICRLPNYEVNKVIGSRIELLNNIAYFYGDQISIHFHVKVGPISVTSGFFLVSWLAHHYKGIGGFMT